MTYSAFQHVVKMHAKTIQVSQQQRRDIDEIDVTLIRQKQALSDTLPEEGTGGGSFVDGVFIPDDKAAAELFATYVQAETQVYQVALEQFEKSLTAKQMVRVREIALQRAYDSGGLYEALKSIHLQPKLAELQVTPLQLADIKEILQSPDPANWEKRGQVDQERNLRKRQLTEDLESQVYAKLTDQQRRLLKELLGPPLDENEVANNFFDIDAIATRGNLTTARKRALALKDDWFRVLFDLDAQDLLILDSQVKGLTEIIGELNDNLADADAAEERDALIRKGRIAICDKVLLPHQAERWPQLVLQFRLKESGLARVLESSDVDPRIRDLRVSPELIEEIRNRTSELVAEAKNDLEQLKKLALSRFHESQLNKKRPALDVLSIEQQQQFHELLGEPIKPSDRSD
ncbi:MAG: hypothetical protein R3C28_16560 [Pirellulaceae bacterium]